MSASGGRRIKRSISIDVTSIRFLDEDEMQRLNKAHLLKPYLTSRHQEINEWNRQPRFYRVDIKPAPNDQYWNLSLPI